MRTRNMKFGLVHMLVALCLCTGVLRTGAKNLRPRVLDPVDFCMGENEHCNKKKDCCEGFNCVGPFTHGSKTCQISHCIPEGKQCSNGERPHNCCEDLVCILQDNGKQNCEPCRDVGEPCGDNDDCCDDLLCAGGKC